MRTVALLMERASGIILLVDRYAGTQPLDIKKMSAKTMITSLVRKFSARFPQMKISLRLARRLPWIHADRSGLQFVLNQLITDFREALIVTQI